MDNQPLAIGLAVTRRPTQPTIALLAILHCSTNLVETMAECHFFACSDA